ncbi:ABC transporter permease [Tissierella sp. Yu-01]|uniref:ABC transporter permease n=1 Tax=Tissierella sp. Yu-01 TaxID=3035694 RepID=UPI00240D53B2|nr:ABC transporter permease [Tissierella sp. Yu-01]WFA10237.1 ABC transporter permease [Tissierella sp. Yu-01]
MSNNFSKEHYDYLNRINNKKRKILITQLGVLIFFLLLWEVSAQLGWIDTFLTSSPSEIWKLFINYLINGQLYYHVGISLFETMVGFVLGTLLGIIIAIGLWWSDFWAKVLDPYMVILNALPKTALAPIFIILFGAGYKGIIATAISVSLVVTILNMFISYKSVDEDKLRLLETFGASKMQILRKVIIPSSVPDLISTLKVNIGLSWVGVIVGEFLVSKAGLGYLIVYGMQVFKLDLVMMNVAVLGFLSAIMYKIIAFIEGKFTKWQR